MLWGLERLSGSSKGLRLFFRQARGGTFSVFRYYIEKFFFQIITVAAIAGFVGVFVYAYSLEDNSPAPVTAQNEIRDSLGKPSVMQEEGSELATQHLSERELASYLDQVISEILSFSPSTYQSNISAASRFFTAGAYEQYKAYLNNAGFERVLGSGYRTGAFLERAPLKLNAVAHNNAFKWLFEVPVTVTFLPSSTNNYDRGAAASQQNQRFTLRVQFTRIQDAQNPNRIAIEIWDVLPARK